MTSINRQLGNEAEKSRHVSMRVPIELFERLEALAADRNESISHAARRLLNEGLEPTGRTAIDDAISTLMSVRDQLSQSVTMAATGPEPESARPAPKTIDILNAKTDLQRLIADVARGGEFVITHAGAPRARLVAVADSPPTAVRNR